MLVPVLAVVLLGERVALPAVIGIALIVVGIYVVSWWGRLRQILARPWALLRDAGVRYAIVTGLTITVYSLVDKRAVEHVQPFLYMYLLTIVSSSWTCAVHSAQLRDGARAKRVGAGTLGPSWRRGCCSSWRTGWR